MLTGTGVAVGPVIASSHEKRTEQRADIRELAGLAEAPTERGRRLREW